jgi:perosamine synthetase
VARVADRDGLVDHLAERQIDTSVYYKPNHLYSVYAPYRCPLPVTEAVWPTLITLPLFPSMTPEQIDRVVQAVRSFHPNGQASSA